MSDTEKLYVQSTHTSAVIPFMYLGAKHMVTGTDHILFLTGVVLFLTRLREIVTVVSFFTLGHSVTLLAGVLSGTVLNVYFIDALIGLSVVYKGLENTGVRFAADRRLLVFVFGLIHGLGLAARLQDLALSEQGLLINLVSFNAGVEVGQIIVLIVVIKCVNLLRRFEAFPLLSHILGGLLVIAGIILMSEQVWLWLSSMNVAS